MLRYATGTAYQYRVTAEYPGFAGHLEPLYQWATTLSVQDETCWKVLKGKASNFLLIANDDTLWGWCENYYGELGVGDRSPRSHPVQVGSDQWLDVAVSANDLISAGIKKDGSLWIWGYLSYLSTIKSSPFQIGTDKDWKQVACQDESFAAIKEDGSLWTWGKNSSGQLGFGDTVTRSSPTRVTSPPGRWIMVDVGYDSTFAVREDGSLWVCGYNGQGQLGLGDTSKRYSFTRALENVKAVSAGLLDTLVILQDGSIMGAGFNYYGELGVGDTSQHPSFTPATVQGPWSFIVCGNYTSLAIKEDGSLWGCGYGGYYRLGIWGDTSNHNTFQPLAGNEWPWKWAAPGRAGSSALRDVPPPSPVPPVDFSELDASIAGLKKLMNFLSPSLFAHGPHVFYHDRSLFRQVIAELYARKSKLPSDQQVIANKLIQFFQQHYSHKR